MPRREGVFYSWSEKTTASTIVCDTDGSTSQKQCNYNKDPHFQSLIKMLVKSQYISISVRGNIEDVSGSKNRFQLVRPCKNLGEVRSLVHELNIASASKRNFVIDKILADVEVRLRRTFHLIWLPPSCAHLR